MNQTEFVEELKSVTESAAKQPARFNDRLGIYYLDCNIEEKWIELGFDVGEWSKNPSGDVHGGVICSLFDTATGMGAVALTQKNVTTTDISVSFLKPFSGTQYVFHIDYNNVGRRMVRAIGKAYDRQSGKLCATSMSSFMIVGERSMAMRV